ncbi:glycosyltransferase family 2 protein [Acidisoma silvae]|uniref:Glycosyltransferase family 2 protein n=1 Tax=Acidisoma silvae TaxID=2802396 RepID=A0A963YTG8_9PROT|nr:glycosyltransferase family 2 protein [Acidisoma silvae]MCB8876369.1 glycosyltransferase family 2 protein [Acidisoma silvae]
MTIAAVTCVRDEADSIEEWIAHHLTLGFDRIHIFDNGSEDQTRAKIEAVTRQIPAVTVQSWQPASGEPQKAAFAAGLDLMRAENAEWCAFLDADEFIANAAADPRTPAGQEGLADFLARHKDHAAIGLNWAIFGSSGHMTKPASLMQQAFLCRAEDGFSVNRHIKSIVRPHAVKDVLHAHGFVLDHPYYTANGDEIVWRMSEHGSAVQPFAYTENFPSLNGWRVNHYFCRWRGRWDEKMRLSRLRDVFWRSEQDWDHHDRNEVFDATALRWAPQVRAKMVELGMIAATVAAARAAAPVVAPVPVAAPVPVQVAPALPERDTRL